MLQITDETRRAFLSDNSHKELSIEFEGNTPENINYFTKIGFNNLSHSPNESVQFTEDGDLDSRYFFRYDKGVTSWGAPDSGLINLTECVDNTYYENYKYWYFSFYPILCKDSEVEILNGTADITLKDVEIGLVYYKNGNYNTMYFQIDNSDLSKLRDQTYWMKFYTDKFLPAFDNNNKLWELCIKVNVKAENVRIDSGQNYIVVIWKAALKNIMFTLSDIPPEDYVYPVFKPSTIEDGVYPPLYPNGIDSNENINYFTGVTKFFDTYSYANISEDRTYDQWDMFYFYPEGSTSYTGNLQSSINEEKSHQYSNLYISIDAKYVDAGITHGTADIEYTGPIWLSVYYVENGEDKTKHISFTDTNIINEFLSQDGTRLHAALYDFITARFFDDNNYIKNIRIHFKVKYSNVTVDSGYSSISHAYDIVFDNLMINLSNTPSSSFEYPPYSKSQIINGVYPMVNIHNDKLMLESFQLTESICSKDNLKFGLSEAANCSFNMADTRDDYINKIFRAYITCNDTEKIPLGRFRVTGVKKETKYNLVTKSITAYDEMFDWEKDATDWYAGYIFGISSEEYTFGGYEFANQMFSTYYNFARFIGYENDDNYQDELIYERDKNNFASHNTNKKYTFGVFDISNIYGDVTPIKGRAIKYKFEINNVSSDYLYKFKKRNIDEYPDDQLWLRFGGPDSNAKKGLLTKASVMVEEVLDDNTYNRYLVNADDYFAISDNCIKLNIYYGIEANYPSTGVEDVFYRIIDNIYVYRTPCPNWVKLLVNKSVRLVYYDWETLEWNTPTCTVRDVFRSLMEINGAFVKINRQGDVECVYSRKGSLYPSETLYPSEDLFPIEDAMLIPSAKYSVSKQEDYQSADFGKIQIKSQNNGKDVITLRTFVGNANYDSTYIIDDNVFFCNSKVKFNYRDNVNGQSVTPYDVLPEINTILGRMFNRISNMGYTPHDTTLVGMPWVETGDRVTLVTYIDAFESFVFRRTMKGIQGLFDTYEAHGDNVIEAYKEVINE